MTPILRSECGWPVVKDPRNQAAHFTAYGVIWYAASDDLAFLVRHVLAQWNAHVEKIDFQDEKVRDDWSWSPLRPVRGTTGFDFISDHCACAAWDINATRHPRGKHALQSGFSPKNVATIRNLLASITDDDGHMIFRWGEDYRTPDPMHVAVREGITAAQVRSARRKLEKAGIR